MNIKIDLNQALFVFAHGTTRSLIKDWSQSLRLNGLIV